MMFIAGALLYKVLCSVAIKRKDRRFVQFLDSFDVFYCLEEKSTTDIQGTIQSNTIEVAAHKIKEKLRNVFINYRTDKIFYRRNEEYGFYYWRRYSNIDLAQYVQIEEVPETFNQKIDKNVGKVQNDNQVITYNDEGLFKVLIMKNNGDLIMNEHKITLKFHHSIKDATLLEFVARLIEKSDDCRVTIHSIPELQDRDSPDAIMNMITKLYDMLACSLEDNSNENKKDITIDKAINRMKALEWTKSDENLLCKVKDAWDLNLTDVIGGVLDKVLKKIER